MGEAVVAGKWLYLETAYDAIRRVAMSFDCHAIVVRYTFLSTMFLSKCARRVLMSRGGTPLVTKRIVNDIITQFVVEMSERVRSVLGQL